MANTLTALVPDLSCELSNFGVEWPFYNSYCAAPGTYSPANTPFFAVPNVKCVGIGIS